MLTSHNTECYQQDKKDLSKAYPGDLSYMVHVLLLWTDLSLKKMEEDKGIEKK
jgi:hypothetical protein